MTAPAPTNAAFEAAPLRPDAVDLWGYLRSEIGQGASARCYAAALRLAGYPGANRDVPIPSRPPTVAYDVDAPDWRAGTNIYVLNPSEMLAGERFVPHRALAETRRIGRWAWELSRFPDRWKPAVDQLDEIWVPSSFIAQSLEGVTVKPVHVLPAPVTRPPPVEKSAARRAALAALPADAFVFLTSFDFGSSIHRKNPSGLLAAFRSAFPEADAGGGPWLVIKAHGRSRADPDAPARLASEVGHAERVLLIDRVFSPAEMFQLHDAADCFVSLHRGEGFGRGLAEMMLAGKPVIGTGYSGNLDFMTEANSFLVDYDLVPVGPGEYWYADGQVWADPRQDSAVAALREVYENRDEAARRAAFGRAAIVDKCSVEAVARMMPILLR